MPRRMIPCLFLALLLGNGLAVRSQEPAISSGSSLTLDQAVALALRDNLQVSNAQLEVEKTEDATAATRTRRLPALDFTFFGSQLLAPVEFMFREGTFGDFPATGPIPATNTRITTPRRPNEILLASASQPLSQLYKIKLSVRAGQLSTDISRERLRQQKQSVVNDVKRIYYGLVQTQSALETAEESIRLYRELDRVVSENLAQQVALKSDSLDVQTRLAKTEYQALVFRQALATQKEQLNVLLGRDIRNDFTVSPVPEATPLEIDLKGSQARALERRPEIREARLKVTQSEYDQRIKKSEYIPDISLRLSYVSPFGIEVLPKNIAALGLYVNWEPFDWGRKKYELAQKAKTIREANNLLRDTETRILVEVNAGFRRLEEGRALLRVSQLARETAREKLRVTTNRYEVRAVQLKDVLAEQTSLAQADSDYQQALVNFWTARADFEKALGEDQ